MRHAALLVAVLVSCASSSSSLRVRDEDFARLAPTHAAQLNEASAELGQAQEELARAKAGGDSVNEAQDAAKAALEEAKEQEAAAEARRRAADARRDHAEKLAEAREAAEEAAARRVELAKAKVELVKLQALEQEKGPALASYDRGAFYDRVARSQRELDDARRKAAERDAQAKEAERRWDELARKVPSR